MKNGKLQRKYEGQTFVTAEEIKTLGITTKKNKKKNQIINPPTDSNQSFLRNNFLT